MEKGCYIFTSNGWRNMNDNLELRGITSNANTITGTPSRDKVPKVFAFTSNGWDQIYPGKTTNVGKITITPRRLDHFKKCRTDGVNWGWDFTAKTAGHGYFGQDWIDSGGQDTSLVNKEYAGWLDLGTYTRGKLPNASNVKEITFLQFVVNRRNLTGLTGSSCNWSLCLNNIDAPGSKKSDKSNDPFNNIVGSPVEVTSFPAGNGLKTVTINLSSSQGQAVANLVKKWMKGEAKSIVMYNNERKNSCVVWNKYGRWSRNYTKLESFKMIIDYTV